PHLYSQPGTYSLTGTVNADSGPQASSSRTIRVADYLLNWVGTAAPIVRAAAGQLANSVTLGVFSGMDTTTPLTAFAVTISWGDGVTSSGSVSRNPNGTFAVVGDHAYQHPGVYPVVVMVAHTAGGPRGSRLVATTAAVVTNPNLTLHPTPLQGVNGQTGEVL